MIEHGATINLRSKKGSDALQISFRLGFFNMSLLLLLNGADPNTIDANGDTLLTWLCKNKVLLILMHTQ